MSKGQRVNLSDISRAHQQAIEAMKDQLLIVLIRRLGGTVKIPVAEVDATGGSALAMSLDQTTREFTFYTKETKRGTEE